MQFIAVSDCRICGSRNLERVLDLGQQPLANSYVKVPTALPTYPLELLVCRRCMHNQLSVVVDPDLMFRDYLYVSGTSRTLREHFKELARQTLKGLNPRPHRVLDLACNDGTLLEAFRDEGCSVCGVDPARNLVGLAQGKGLDVVEGYWPHVRHKLTGKFDLITAANVLAHVADPKAFLQAALEYLNPGGEVVVEFPYCRSMILQGEWDTIYHEHLSYFLVGPILTLAEILGASITKAEMVPVHGGSLRIAIQPRPAEHCEEAKRFAEAEKHDGLCALETYRAFANRVDSVCADLNRAVTEAAESGNRVIGFGASAKGNTLLNRSGLSVDYIVDDNPLKHGYYTPGRNISIRSPSVLAGEPRDLSILLLAWNFAQEIIGKVNSWRPNRNDEVIHYIPEVFRHGIRNPMPKWRFA